MNKVNILTVPIGLLDPNPWNPNKQSAFVFDKEKESIKKHGFIDPVTVRQKGDRFEIIDGEHRWRACTESGFNEIAVNNLGDIPDKEAKALTIIMNELKGEADAGLMSNLIKNLSEEMSLEELQHALPFSETEISTFLEASNIDWTQRNENQNDAGGSGGSDDADWETYMVRLPENITSRLRAQISRFKALISPQNPDLISDVVAIETLVVHLENSMDQNLT